MTVISLDTLARDVIDRIADDITRDPAIRLHVTRRLADALADIELRLREADEPPDLPKPA